VIPMDLARRALATASAIRLRVGAGAGILIYHEKTFNNGASRGPYFLENIAVALRSTARD